MEERRRQLQASAEEVRSILLSVWAEAEEVRRMKRPVSAEEVLRMKGPVSAEAVAVAEEVHRKKGQASAEAVAEEVLRMLTVVSAEELRSNPLTVLVAVVGVVRNR